VTDGRTDGQTDRQTDGIAWHIRAIAYMLSRVIKHAIKLKTSPAGLAHKCTTVAALISILF